MSAPFFPEIEAVTHEGPDSEDPLAYRFYEAERPVLGKPMREQLRHRKASSSRSCGATTAILRVMVRPLLQPSWMMNR